MAALNRFGLGARPGEAEKIDDPRGWLMAQIQGAPPSLAETPPTDAEVAKVQADFIEANRAKDKDRRKAAAKAMVNLRRREVGHVLTTRVVTDRPFAERWVAFWSNHLCVSTANAQRLAVLVGAYERQAIRPHVFGKFEDMLLASARHPAMLLYLDNNASVGPDSPAVTRRRGRKRRKPPRPRRTDINENYARELLELHTVGVDAGYTQEDVIQLARMLTGWTFQGPGDRNKHPLGFRFAPRTHEPGAKTVMGVRYKEAGEAEGVHVLRDLAHRPETARHIATKIVRHFVADDPPPAVVARLAKLWTDTGGDLRRIATALVHSDEAWQEKHKKFRSPQDWVVASLRVLGTKEVPPLAAGALRQLRHTLWAPKAPKGYDDVTSTWADPDSLIKRIRTSRAFARRFGSSTDPGMLLDVVASADAELIRMVRDPAARPVDRVALFLASPEFQWR